MSQVCVISLRDINDEQILRSANAITKTNKKVKVLILGLLTTSNLESNISSDNDRINLYPISLLTKRLPSTLSVCLVFKYLEFIIRISMIMLRQKPQIIHAHDLPMLLPGCAVKKVTGSILIYEAHELYFDTCWVKLPKLFKLLENLLMPLVNQLICPTKARANIYATRYDLKNEPLLIKNVCPKLNINNRNKEKYRGILLALLQRNFPDISHNNFILLYGGLVAPGRGLESVLHEVPLFDKRILLIIVGAENNKYAIYLKQLIRDLNIDDRVVIYNRVEWDKMVKFMSGADCGLIVYENNCLNNYLCAPMKLYEMIQCHTPIISVDFPELCEVVEKNHIGVTFNLDEKGNLATVLNSILTDNNKLLAFRDNIERVADNFSWNNEQKKLIEFYQNIRMAESKGY